MVLRVGIKIHGLKRVQKLLMNFPKVMLNETDKVLERFNKGVVTSARRRTPRGGMGYLASQITFKKTKQGHFIIDTGNAYYALAIERGFKPHWIPAAYIQAHWENPSVSMKGSNLSMEEISATGGFVKFGKGPRPFMKPAFESELAKLRTRWSNVIKTSLNKSRR